MGLSDVLLIVFFTAFLAYSVVVVSRPHTEEEKVQHFVTKDGVECYKSAEGGLSCNWDKYNDERNFITTMNTLCGASR